MIAQITGTITELLDDRIIITVNGLGYEVMVPLGSRPEMAQRLRLPETVLYTLEYFEGNPGKGNLIPRLVGFLSPQDKQFFELFITVDGIGMRKALRALSAAPAEIARAVEGRDARRLAELPEIGKRTAEKIIAELHGKLERFAWPQGERAPAAVVKAAPQFQLDAREVLVQLGERATDAEELIARAVKAAPKIDSAPELLNEVYRIKAGRR